MRQYAGASLIELMISLLLSSMIISILVQQYSLYITHYHQTQQQVTQAMDRQWVIELLQDSIRHAGFTPCLGINHLTSVGLNNLPLSAIKNVDLWQKELVLHRMSNHFVALVDILNPKQLIVKEALDKRYPIVVADCLHAEIQTIEHIQPLVNSWQITLKSALFFDYQKPSYIGEWITERFFIKSNHEGAQALFYQRHTTEELTPFIDNLVINVVKKTSTFVNVSLGFKQQQFTIKTRVRI